MWMHGQTEGEEIIISKSQFRVLILAKHPIFCLKIELFKNIWDCVHVKEFCHTSTFQSFINLQLCKGFVPQKCF